MSPVGTIERSNFTLNPQGRVDEMKLDVPNPDFDFKEREFKRVNQARASNGN